MPLEKPTSSPSPRIRQVKLGIGATSTGLVAVPATEPKAKIHYPFCGQMRSRVRFVRSGVYTFLRWNNEPTDARYAQTISPVFTDC